VYAQRLITERVAKEEIARLKKEANIRKREKSTMKKIMYRKGVEACA